MLRLEDCEFKVILGYIVRTCVLPTPPKIKRKEKK
jgi:hypothetical protein